jgi:hypothetical protein
MLLGLLIYATDESNAFLQNNGKYLTEFTASNPKDNSL